MGHIAQIVHILICRYQFWRTEYRKRIDDVLKLAVTLNCESLSFPATQDRPEQKPAGVNNNMNGNKINALTIAVRIICC